MSEQVRLIQKEEILAWIKADGVRGYKYRANVGGAWFLIIVGAITLGLGAFLAYRTGLAFFIHKLGFAILAGFTIWAFWLVGHWMLFSVRNYIGVSDSALLIGRGSRAYLVPRSRLNRDTVKFNEMQRGKLTSVLPIEIGTYKAAIHLFGPMANMVNVAQFVADVLESLLGDDSDEASIAEPEADAPEPDDAASDEAH